VCEGRGYPNTVGLKSLCVGDLFQTINGDEHMVVRKNADGCVVATQTGKYANTQEYWPHNPSVRVIRRADVAFFLPANP